MITDYHEQLLELYNEDYNKALKPILALVEALLEKHPSAILNEIRAFNDHIARCYIPTKDDTFIVKNIDRAKGHIKRAILDCFKNLNIYYHREVEKFEKVYRNVDLTLVNNGKFYPQFLSLKKQAVQKVHEAKCAETLDFEKAFDLYQEGYFAYDKVNRFIIENTVQIGWAKKRFFQKHKKSIANSVISLVMGSFLGSFFFSPMADAVKNKICPRIQSPSVQTKEVKANETMKHKLPMHIKKPPDN